MSNRRHVLQRAKASHVIAVGLLFGIMTAIPPHIHAAYVERIGMIESTDWGATWKFKGHAEFHAPELNPVDPSALVDNGTLVFYFFDLLSLSADPAVVYRSVALDGGGLDFSPPAPAFKFPGFLTDPSVVKLPDNKYRMYVHGEKAILSAASDDGRIFTLEPGDRTMAGGVPGALVLPEGRVRLFVCGQGITSLISENGLDFTQEPGVRIPLPPGAAVVADPSPIRVADGTFRMAYKIRPEGQTGPELDEVHLAESMDGFSWTPGSVSLVTGSVPTLVELPDGRWRIYYVDFQPDEPKGLFPAEGTIGTETTILGSEFGTEKGKALVGKAALKILEWTDDSIRCLLTKALPPDIYEVTIQPQAKGSSPIIIEHGFTVKAPKIDSVDPTTGSTGDEITIHGFFFGTKKGKVTLGGESCKVLSWTMDPTTGESEIRVVVPKGLSPGVNEFKVTTGVGMDTVNFTVE